MSVKENLRKGMRAARAGRTSEAHAAFLSVLDEDPLNETALLWLGYLEDDPHVGLTYVARALETHPQSSRAYAALLWAWRRMAALPAVAASGNGATSSLKSSPPGSPGLRGLRQVLVGLPTLGVLLLLVAVIGWTVGHLFLAEPPAMAAWNSVSTPLPSPTSPRLQDPPVEPSAVAVLLSDSPGSSALITAASSTSAIDLTPTPGSLPASPPTAIPSPVPSPTPSPTPPLLPSSVPSPVPSPSPSPVALVVPDPFPIPGPRAYVPSTTLPIPTPVQPVPVASDAINIAVLGSDRREDWTEWHTDVVQIVSIQRDRAAVSVLSVPRDLYVYIPSLWMSRVNFADFYGEAYDYDGGGPALVRDTLLYNLGVRVDHYVRTNFDGLIGIVDTIGGVDIPVHCRLSDYWPYPDENGEYPILTMEPGVHHMDGETALWYARSRKTTSVFSRERRQQQVLQAIWREARDAGMLSRVPALWKQGRSMIETDLTFTDILDLARVALALEEQNVRFYNIGAAEVTPWTTPYGGAVFLPRWEEIQPIVAEAMAPLPEGRLNRTYKLVEVWNGTSNQDWDLLAVDRLYRAGFPAVVGEPDRQDYAATQLIIFRESIKGSGAEYLQHMFDISDDRVFHQPDESSSFGFRLIVGADYQTCPW